MNKTYQIIGLIAIVLVSLVSCAKPIEPYTIKMSDGLTVKIQQMIDGKEAEAILKNIPGNNVKIPTEEEFLILKLAFTNNSQSMITIPYLYFLQIDTKSEPPKTEQIYFKDEFIMPEDGNWKKLNRLERIPAGEKREGAICFVVPKNIILKRFYVYQTYLSFPTGFLPSNLK